MSGRGNEKPLFLGVFLVASEGIEGDVQNPINGLAPILYFHPNP